VNALLHVDKLEIMAKLHNVAALQSFLALYFWLAQHLLFINKYQKVVNICSCNGLFIFKVLNASMF